MTPIRAAAESGDWESVRHLLSEGADANTIGCNGYPLFSQSPDVETLRCFVDHGANINARLRCGQTMLMATEDLEIAKLLISAGAYLNVLDNYDNSILDTEDINKLRLLLESGANPNAHNKARINQLLKRNSLEKMELLLQFGADPNALGIDPDVYETEKDISPVIVALKSRENNREKYELLLKYGARSLTVDEMIEHGKNDELFPLLIKNFHKEDKQKILKEFCWSGHRHNVSLDTLLKNGLDPFTTNDFGDSLLFIRIDEELLDMGLDPYHKNDDGQTCWEKKGLWFHEYKLLKERGIIFDLDAVELPYNSRLCRDLDDVQAFLNEGADINKGGAHASLASKLIENHGLNEETLEILKNNNWDPNVRYYNGQYVAEDEIGSEKIIDKLLSMGWKPVDEDKNGKTILFRRIGQKYLEKFMNAGLDINHRDNYGRSPIFYARNKGALDLLNAGADIEMRDYGEFTAPEYNDDLRDILENIKNSEVTGQTPDWWFEN